MRLLLLQRVRPIERCHQRRQFALVPPGRRYPGALSDDVLEM